MNDAHDFATLYRGLLLAKITARHTPTGGPLAGKKVYEWVEQTFNPLNATNISAFPPQEGGVYVGGGILELLNRPQQCRPTYRGVCLDQDEGRCCRDYRV